jgi:hypothetical protein
LLPNLPVPAPSCGRHSFCQIVIKLQITKKCDLFAGNSSVPRFQESHEFTRNLGAGIVPKRLDKKIASNGWVGTVGDMRKWENARKSKVQETEQANPDLEILPQNQETKKQRRNL